MKNQRKLRKQRKLKHQMKRSKKSKKFYRKSMSSKKVVSFLEFLEEAKRLKLVQLYLRIPSKPLLKKWLNSIKEKRFPEGKLENTFLHSSSIKSLWVFSGDP